PANLVNRPSSLSNMWWKRLRSVCRNYARSRVTASLNGAVWFAQQNVKASIGAVDGIGRIRFATQSRRETSPSYGLFTVS
ncbi:MAG: hypothetical protein ACK56I_33780, partial [bacterium]